MRSNGRREGNADWKGSLFRFRGGTAEVVIESVMGAWGFFAGLLWRLGSDFVDSIGD